MNSSSNKRESQDGPAAQGDRKRSKSPPARKSLAAGNSRWRAAPGDTTRSTRRTSEEHKAAGISELRPPNGDAEKRLMDIECRWNVYDVVLCKRIGLTDYDGNPDWGQFEKFLETLKRRPFAEKELNAERMGTQVRKAAGIPTALVPHVWRCGQNSDPFDQTQLTGAVFPAVLSEATPYATVTMEMQRLFAGDCNRRPAAIAAAINDDIYGAGWQDWVPFGVWLCEEYPLLLRSARVQRAL